MSPSFPLGGGAQHHLFLSLSVKRRGSTLLYQLLLKPTTRLKHHNHRLNPLRSQTSPQPSWWNTITSTWLCLSRVNLIRVSLNAPVLLWQFVFYSIFFITTQLVEHHHLYVALWREENQLDKSCNWGTTITETWFSSLAKIKWQFILRLFPTKSPSSHIVHLYSGKKNPVLLGRL